MFRMFLQLLLCVVPVNLAFPARQLQFDKRSQILELLYNQSSKETLSLLHTTVCSLVGQTFGSHEIEKGPQICEKLSVP
jgi:hypothetical protein